MRGLLAALLTFLIYLAVHALLFRFVVIRRKFSVMTWLWLGGYLMYVPAFLLLPDDAAYLPALLSAPADTVTWINGALVYWFLTSGYYQFFNMADNSVGVRSLIEFSRVPDRGLSLAELKAHYSYDVMLGRRMERLVVAGFLSKDGERYSCLPKGRLAAKFMAGLKNFLNISPGG